MEDFTKSEVQSRRRRDNGGSCLTFEGSAPRLIPVSPADLSRRFFCNVKVQYLGWRAGLLDPLALAAIIGMIVVDLTLSSSLFF